MHYREKGSSCTGGTYINASGPMLPTVSSFTLTGLASDTTYCWYVVRTNSGHAIVSATWQFTTGSLPQMVSAAINTPINCGGARISGLYTNPNVNNPVTFTMDVSDSRGVAYLKTASVGILPSSVQNADTVTGTILEPSLHDYVGFQIANLGSLGALQYSSADNASQPVWNAKAPPGNLPNAAGTATLMDLGGNTTVTQLDANTLRVVFQIRFESTYPTADLNVYAMVTADDGSGGSVSQDTDASNNLTYRKVDTWKTDMQAPFVQVGTPVTTGTNTFSINWQANDTSTGGNGITAASSTCLIDTGTASLTDQTLAQNISLTTSPVNCLVTQSNLGTHNYRLNSSTGNIITYNLSATDGACNVSNASTGLNSSADPWMMTAKGSVSAGAGFTNITIPNIASLTSVLPSLGNDAFLSTNLAISGTNTVLTGRNSKYNFIGKNYQDLNFNSPQLGGTNSWFDDLSTVALARAGAFILDIAPGVYNPAASLPNPLPPITTGAIVARVNGNLTLNPGSDCVVPVLLLVYGNLTLRPDFTASGNNICAVIVKGNVTIEPGNNKNPSPGTGGPLVYDNVALFIVSDGDVTIQNDPAGAGKLADPLYIKGGLVAKNVHFLRDLGGFTNGAQPAEVIEYDPNVMLTLKDLLAVNEFSLRSK